MTRQLLFLLIVIVFNTKFSIGQTAFTEDFNDNILSVSWSQNTTYVLTEANQELKVDATNAGSNWQTFSVSFPALDLSVYPYVKIKVKSATAVKFRIDLADNAGWVTNKNAIVKTIPGNDAYGEYAFDFSGLFFQEYAAANPGKDTVDQTKITTVSIFFNGGGPAFTGTVFLDDLRVGSATGIVPPPPGIRLNQLGFYPDAPKTAIIVSAPAGPFYITSLDKQDTLYTGALGNAASFSLSGETVRKATFSDFDSVGQFYVNIPGVGYSLPFTIKPAIHASLSKAALKAFYYQRASMALTAPYAGIYARGAGHPDTSVLIHNSAASPLRATGSKVSCPRGWYDAGDLNKYIVSAGISAYTLMALYEHYPGYYDTLNLNIPESNNAIPDILDEVLWELRWLLTMQDPWDGGVYTKLTDVNFNASGMPSSSNTTRYVVQKSTAASLDYAATLAQAARIYKHFESALPGLADSCINAAVKAWIWAKKNPAVAYDQSKIVSPVISTGGYGDGTFTDERQWAGFELYTTTQLDSFYTRAGALVAGLSIPGWQDVKSLGYYTLAHHRSQLTPLADTTTVKFRVLSMANGFRTSVNTSAYGIAMTSDWNFSWGSNGIAANQGMILLQAFDITKDTTYLHSAIASLDYILGRNGTNYSFVTGYGNKTPMDIHSRISNSDGIQEPVPGLLAGGPTTDALTDCGAALYPSSTLKAKAYVDKYCSYSTNEIAINWNAPLAYLSGAIEAIMAGTSSKVLPLKVVRPTNTTLLGMNEDLAENDKVFAYPNPFANEISIRVSTTSTAPLQLKITDITGKVLFSSTKYATNAPIVISENLPDGILLVQAIYQNKVKTFKVIKKN